MVKKNKITKKRNWGEYEKKNSSRPFLGHSGGGQETTLYFRVALERGFGCVVGDRVRPW